ncbi:phosphotransferase family protein [Carnobacteriaceae bacterium zg-ZUI252]|nr:phosphotransferase family protein [Carnobacteriaceae bacterium zg-ZUI252]QTU82441.1 phosphotransferase family protein [Carnobacteriaceae bacterium zg-C25]
MSYSFDLEWEMAPLGGGTGQSYKGVKGEQTIFLKRNTTPFLAAVSVEGIAPKLLWTRRTANGEGITAQEWIEGDTLQPVQMVEHDVLAMVKAIHESATLKGMLEKIQGSSATPTQLLAEYQESLQVDLRQNSFLNRVVDYLYHTANQLEKVDSVVCHGDLSHANFLLEKTGRLYLVDWENVKLCDPLLDVASILCRYINYSDWEKWLEVYGVTLTPSVQLRLQWFCILTYLMDIKKSHFYGRNHQVNYAIMMIKKIMQ